MKILKVEGVYPLEFETADDVAEYLPAFIEKYNAKRLHYALGYLSPYNTQPPVNASPDHVRPWGGTPPSVGPR